MVGSVVAFAGAGAAAGLAALLVAGAGFVGA